MPSYYCELVVVAADLLDKPGGSVSVLAGGCVTGWSPEVAVVLWRRILGSLGNINDIRDTGIHEQVYEFFCDLVSTLVKVIHAVHFFSDSVLLVWQHKQHPASKPRPPYWQARLRPSSISDERGRNIE